MATEVITSSAAEADIRRNAGRIRRNVSAAAAGRWTDRIVAAITTLVDRPERYPEADEAGDLGLDLPFKLHGRRPHVYRILFTIAGGTVNVFRVRHAAEDALTDADL